MRGAASVSALVALVALASSAPGRDIAPGRRPTSRPMPLKGDGSKPVRQGSDAVRPGRFSSASRSWTVSGRQIRDPRELPHAVDLVESDLVGAARATGRGAVALHRDLLHQQDLGAVPLEVRQTGFPDLGVDRGGRLLLAVP